MLRFLYADELERFPKLRDSMFRDRTAQFRDRLGWPVTVDENGFERDEYDGENPLYVIWQLPNGCHGGSMRFLPTTGRTMVNEHFLHLTGGASIESAVIWECTRFCLSKASDSRSAAALMLGGGEIMQRFGVDHFVGVFDGPMERVYRRIGSAPEVLGAAGKGRGRTCVGLWSFSPAAQACVARRAGLAPGLIRLWFDRAFGRSEQLRMTG